MRYIRSRDANRHFCNDCSLKRRKPSATANNCVLQVSIRPVVARWASLIDSQNLGLLVGKKMRGGLGATQARLTAQLSSSLARQPFNSLFPLGRTRRSIWPARFVAPKTQLLSSVPNGWPLVVATNQPCALRTKALPRDSPMVLPSHLHASCRNFQPQPPSSQHIQSSS